MKDIPRGSSMAIGGYCSVCARWVWLTPYGECQNGHPTSAARGRRLGIGDDDRLRLRLELLDVAHRRRRVTVLALPVGCEPDPAGADAAVSTNGHGAPSRNVLHCAG